MAKLKFIDYAEKLTVDDANCEFFDNVELYFDGKLDAAQQEAVRQHMRHCSSCAMLGSDLEKMIMLFSYGVEQDLHSLISNNILLQESWLDVRVHGLATVEPYQRIKWSVIEEHIESCPSCRQEYYANYDAYKQLSALVRKLLLEESLY